MDALTQTQRRVEVERLGRYANVFDNAAFGPVAELSALPYVEAAEVFDRLRGHLQAGDRGPIERALDEFVGGA
ncbi:hypothetical protein [Actinomadura macra]|uniref:hypothetical protein n=1 Tax=Actinomadura macra TaxID=46164 RepID=UPI000834BE7D|nr:hypothetical protein [Actinomadura macra]